MFAAAVAFSASAGSPVAAASPAAARHGILLLVCTGRTLTIRSYQATPGARPATVASFSLPGGNVGNNNLQCEQDVPSPLLLQQFNSTFTMMAVDIGLANNEGHVGVLTSTGKLRDFTPASKASGGFNGPKVIPDEHSALFQPGTSNLYFVGGPGSAPHYYKLNATAAKPVRQPVADTRQKDDHAFNNTDPDWFLFSPNGKQMTTFIERTETKPGYADNYGFNENETPFLFSPSGQFAAADGGSPGNTCLIVRPAATLYDETTCVEGSNDLWINAWVSDTTLLATGPQDDGALDAAVVRLVSVPADPEQATDRAIVPQVGRENSDPVPDPSGTKFAFLSRDPNSGVEQLWIGSLSGGTPQKVADLPYLVRGVDGRLMAWK